MRISVAYWNIPAEDTSAKSNMETLDKGFLQNNYDFLLKCLSPKAPGQTAGRK